MRNTKLAGWALWMTLLPGTILAQVGKPVTIVDPSTATAAQLGAVPGFTPALVQELIAARPFLRQAEFDAFLAPKLTPAQRVEAYKDGLKRRAQKRASRKVSDG